jgi:sucrose phosphorylase
MNLSRGVMLITYPDSLGPNLAGLREVLGRFFDGAVAGVHVLPFYPSSSDRGFSPTRYDIVSPEFGDWTDLADLAKSYYLMYDFMINHLSGRSVQFRDFVANRDASPYAGMFIRYKDFWPPGRPTPEDLARIYKRKPRAPSVTVTFADGSSEDVWCTFGDDQIDLNLKNEVAWRFVEDNLAALAARGPALVRLDAVAYAAKKAGGTCFFEEPETWDILARARDVLAPHGIEVLPEVHEHYGLQLKLAEHGYRVYDFALPMLLLHALSTGGTRELAHWLRICPRRQFTTLDTHDGIGVVDVAGLLTGAQIERVKALVFSRDATVQEIHVPGAYQALDIYQLNCTYYSALGHDDDAYLAARAVQVFAPGIPQVYYVGLLAGRNDLALVERTRHGRDINRHAYTVEEIAREVERPVVRRLLSLLRFRNEFPAFDGDDCEVTENGSSLTVTRTGHGCRAVLVADMKTRACSIWYSGLDGQGRTLDL